MTGRFSFSAVTSASNEASAPSMAGPLAAGKPSKPASVTTYTACVFAYVFTAPSHTHEPQESPGMKTIAGEPAPYFSTRNVPTVVTLVGLAPALPGLAVAACARLAEEDERASAPSAIAGSRARRSRVI